MKKKRQYFEAITSDTALLSRLAGQQESISDFTSLHNEVFGLFIYTKADEFTSPAMKFWSQQFATPPDDLIFSADGEYFRKLSNGWYVIIKKTIRIQAGEVYAFSVIPVRSEFFITTDYLPEKFAFSGSADQRVKLSEKPTEFPVHGSTGAALFYLDKKISVAVPYNDKKTVLIRLGGLLLLLIFLQMLAETTASRRNIWQGIIVLIVSFTLVRFVFYLYPGLFNLRQFEFFNPAVYGSNIVQRSLGDLFFNSILLGWIVLFSWFRLRHIENPGSIFSNKWKWVAGITALLLLVAGSFVVASVVRSLVADSKISFDITNFFSLDVNTIAGFFILSCLSLTYYFLSLLLLRLIYPLFGGRDWLIYFAIAFAGLLLLSLRTGHADVLFYLPVLVWLLGYTWLISKRQLLFARFRINIAGTLTWIFIFSVSIAAIMLSQNKKVEWEKRKLIADKLAVQTDPSSERLLSIAVKYIDDDFLSDNFSRFANESESKKIRDSIITDSYSGYLDKYDTRLYVYDKGDKPLFNEDLTTYESLNTIFTVQAKPAETEGLYYYERSFDKFNYITKREVKDTAANKMGTFFIVSNLKNYSRDALFPELFRQFREADLENSPIYSNAVYINKRLVTHPGNYPYANWLTDTEVPDEEYLLKRNGDYDELWYRAGKDKVVVVARKKETAIEAITLFSYIFCSFLFLVMILELISLFTKIGFSLSGVKKFLQFNIRTQVHGTIIFISVFSFLIIGAATISFFISRNKQSNSDKLSRTMKIMVNEMEKKMSDHNTFDDVVKIYDSVSNNDLQKLVDEVSDIHGVDVNVYDLNGDLQVSSEANVYTKGVLSKKMEPRAFYYLNRLRKVHYLQEEKVGDFSYYSIYAPVRNDEGVVDAYVNIPYFTSTPELRQAISNFLVTLINLNAFIFLIAGLIALFITNRITNSFSIIGDKMKEVKLGKTNEAITWSRNDEIGDLVQEYNKMVAKLGESAEALAKSEREGAWREMARQVAHEIKNPLTPMKLSIQYLQKSIDNNQPNIKELTASVANTLVEQIDHLSKIAADFSQFANIGNTHAEAFDLHDIIHSLKELFAPDLHASIRWNAVGERLQMFADKTQMNRLFTNL
ncbi:MAG: histidine kinase [Chitinophagaceae bacterium]|nr:histidine kinase [Chitinophagaceae bacterium]